MALAATGAAASLAAPPVALALLPLALAVGQVVQAAQRARGNKNEARMLATRAEDCGSKMGEVVTAVAALPDSVDRARAVARTIERLAQVIEDCATYIAEFGKKVSAVV